VSGGSDAAGTTAAGNGTGGSQGGGTGGDPGGRQTAVQLDKQEQFDRLWTWVKNHMANGTTGEIGGSARPAVRSCRTAARRTAKSTWRPRSSSQGFGLPAESGKSFVDRLWSAPIPTSQWRCYDGTLYMLSLLHVAGTFS
jgi:hypothetical protein